MTLKELYQLRNLNREIEYHKKRIELLRANALSPSKPNLSDSSFDGYDSSRVERYAAEIIDTEAIIHSLTLQCIHERNRLERYIANISDSLTRQIFSLRFVDGFNWTQIANKVGNNTGDSVKKICYRYLRKK